ncbi:MAG: hypothetical protein Q4C13_04780 [Clostridia bacterium]|nr:hypothetical protein [Clostridia bacterium]
MLYAILFVLGGGLYVTLELFWRSRSHISMFIAGGVSLVLLYGVFSYFEALPALLLCLIGALVISAVEFITGAIVNLQMHLRVWDYSHLPCNLYGQVCLRYSALWALLCAPLTLLPGLIAAL